jgi:SAM-dependent methyltransferase
MRVVPRGGGRRGKRIIHGGGTLSGHPDNEQIAGAPSAWVSRWARCIPAGSLVLDLACGSGRHSRYLAALGYQVLAVDRDARALEGLRGLARIETLVADLESAAWPLPGRTFGGVVVANYLHRPLFADIVAALAPGGALIYETFAVGNERFGKPSNAAFLLRTGELLGVAQGILKVVAYEDVQVVEPRPAMVQRLCAVRDGGAP